MPLYAESIRRMAGWAVEPWRFQISIEKNSRNVSGWVLIILPKWRGQLVRSDES